MSERALNKPRALLTAEEAERLIDEATLPRSVDIKPIYVVFALRDVRLNMRLLRSLPTTFNAQAKWRGRSTSCTFARRWAEPW